MTEILARDTEGIFILCLSAYEGLVNLVFIYALTLQTAPEVKVKKKQQFYVQGQRPQAYPSI